MSRGRLVGLVAAVLMVLLGGLWALQGMGYVGGSAMTGRPLWAYLGSALAGLGVALGIVVLQRRRP